MANNALDRGQKPSNAFGHRLLFLCSEHCEQALFAELVFNYEAVKIDLSWKASDAGIFPGAEIASNFDPAEGNTNRSWSVFTTAALKELGLNPTVDVSRFSLQISEDKLDSADLIWHCLRKRSVLRFKTDVRFGKSRSNTGTLNLDRICQA